MEPKKYALRYFIDDWNKPVPVDPGQVRVAPGVVKSADDFGYTDELVVFSILKDDDGSISSIAVFDSESGIGRPSRALCTQVLEYLKHYMSEHC